MFQPVYEMILWNNCNNNCKFCWLKSKRDKCPDKFISIEDTKRPIFLAKEFTKLLCNNRPGSSMLFMGGELFDRKLPKHANKLFMELIDVCIHEIDSNKMDMIYFNTNLIYDDTKLLFDILDQFKKNGLLHKVQITTSYDWSYRYKSTADMWKATSNMRTISEKYPNSIRVANMIMTHVCEYIISVEPMFIHNFLMDTGFRLNLIPYIALDKDIALKRNEQLTFLLKVKDHYPEVLDMMVQGYNNKKPKVLFEYDGNGFVMQTARNAQCGHPENFRKVYADSDKCFVCDLINLVKTESI